MFFAFRGKMLTEEETAFSHHRHHLATTQLTVVNGISGSNSYKTHQSPSVQKPAKTISVGAETTTNNVVGRVLTTDRTGTSQPAPLPSSSLSSLRKQARTSKTPTNGRNKARTNCSCFCISLSHLHCTASPSSSH